MDFLKEKFPPGTILFIDKNCSNALSLNYKLENFMKEKFSLICNIDNDSTSIKHLIEKFINLFDFEHIVIFVSSPIRNFKDQIMTILDFGVFDIIKIITTVQNDDFSCLNETAQETSIQYVLPLTYQIDEDFTIVPTFPDVFSLYIQDNNEKYKELLDSCASSISNLFNSRSIKYFAYGKLSEELASNLNSNIKGNAVAATLLIDRNMCAAPLFTHEGSLLDKASWFDYISVLQDKELVSSEINGELLNSLAQILKVEPKFNKIKDAWSKLSNEEKFNVAKIHPSVPYIFYDEDLSLLNMQKLLLSGADLSDVIDESSQISEYNIFQLLGLKNSISPINIHENVSKLVSDSNAQIRMSTILSKCKSGVELEPDEPCSFKDLFYLPSLLRFIFQKDASLNDGIVTSNSTTLLGSFLSGQSTSLKDFNVIYVFIIGGISFYEVSEIHKMIKQKNTTTQFHIFTDSVCMPIKSNS